MQASQQPDSVDENRPESDSSMSTGQKVEEQTSSPSETEKPDISSVNSRVRTLFYFRLVCFEHFFLMGMFCYFLYVYSMVDGCYQCVLESIDMLRVSWFLDHVLAYRAL